MTARLLRALEADLNGLRRARVDARAHVWAELQVAPVAPGVEATLGGEPYGPLSDARLAGLLDGLCAAFTPVRDDLAGVWLHGSLATGDYTDYSDVDALVVLRDHALEDPHAYRRVQAAVRVALRRVLIFDPLQHHGFFVACERALAAWPATYLPGVALQYARPLWPGPALPVVESPDPAGARAAFAVLARSVAGAPRPHNLHEAKLLLSQFMLLPALYKQARGQALYKRESFPAVRPAFAAQWAAMDTATRLRAVWTNPARPLWAAALRALGPWQAGRVYRRFETRLPSASEWPALLTGMRALAAVMRAALPAGERTRD
jgi:hypothetical protein